MERNIIKGGTMMELEKIKSALFDVEEFAEIISDRVIEKLSSRFEIEKNDRDYFSQDFYEGNLAECDFENLFQWSNLKGKWIVEIIDPIFYDFFERYLGKSNKKLIKKLLKGFESDVIVRLMDNSLSNLVCHVKDNGAIQNPLYYEDNVFYDEISYYTNKLNIEENESVLSKVEEYMELISTSIPLQLIPFGAYALVNSENISKNLVTDIISNIQHLQLKWLTRTAPNIKEKNKDADRILLGQVAFGDFTQLLNLVNINHNLNDRSRKYNTSLNFYVFNKYTSLYDVYLLSSELFKKSRLIRLQRQYPNKIYNELNYTERYIFKKNLCEDFAPLMMIEGVLFKRFIIKNHLNTQKFNSIGFANFANAIIDTCMYELGDSICLMYKNDPKFSDLPEDIRKDAIVLETLLEGYSPYNKFIMKTAEEFMALEHPITSQKEKIKYELYHYAYKAIFNEKKQMSKE